MHGEEASGSGSDTDYTEEQAEAIDRVDELVGRLQAMSWRPEVADALSALGEIACRYNKELGAYAFETAYSVVAGLEFDLEDDWSYVSPVASYSHCSSRHKLGWGRRPQSGT